MVIRLPHGRTSLSAGNAAHGALEAELLNEKVESLGRAGRLAEQALAALAGFSGETGSAEHEELRDRAAGRVQDFIVQRELCGFADAAAVVRDLAVPPEVRVRLGAVRRPR